MYPTQYTIIFFVKKKPPINGPYFALKWKIEYHKKVNSYSMVNSFWSSSQEKLFSELKTGPEGLSTEAANTILQQENKKKKKKSKWRRDIEMFLGQFRSPLMLMLVGAVILSSFVGEASDVFIILFILLATGILGFFQERNAGDAIAKLQSMIQLKNTVIRDGKAMEIHS